MCFSGKHWRNQSRRRRRHHNSPNKVRAEVVTNRHSFGVETSSKSYFCSACGRTYTRLDNLRRHQKVECGNKEKTFHCNFCPKTYYYRFELKDHYLRGHYVPKDMLGQMLDIIWAFSFRMIILLFLIVFVGNIVTDLIIEIINRKFNDEKTLQVYVTNSNNYAT